MKSPSICRTCQYWDKRFPNNPQIGVCLRMGVMAFGSDVTLSMAGAEQKPVSDFAAVRTRWNFGCIFHSDDPAMALTG